MTTILIVEDDVDTNEALSEYFEEAGYQVVSAYDGEEAISLFSENSIDLVILDIMLPKITGLAVLNTIRKSSQVPVLMLTVILSPVLFAVSQSNPSKIYAPHHYHEEYQ